MKSVLLTTRIFPPDIGGPATYIDRLAHALVARGVQVTVLCATAAPSEEDRHRPFRVYRIPRSAPAFRARLVARCGRELLRHSGALVNGLEYVAAVAAQLVGRRYVLKVVGDTVWETARNAGLTTDGIDEFRFETSTDPEVRRQAARRRRSLRMAAAVITPSRYVREMVVSWGVSPDRVCVIPNGVPLEEYASYQPCVRSAEQPLRVAFCGRLTNWKGVDTLLRAAQGVPRVHLEILGDGPEFPRLSQLARTLRVEDIVTFTGRLESPAVRRRLSLAHALVLDSTYEGHSQTLLEASAMGLPCIASSSGGNPEVIRDGETGILVPVGNVQVLRKALLELCTDEARRFRLACAAKAASRRFPFEQTVEQTMAVLKRFAR